MPESDLVARVEEALAVDPDTFRSEAMAEAETIVAAIEDGAFDNPQAIVGFEYEFYAVDAETTALARVPRQLLELIGFEKELGLHNAEMSTSPQPLNPHGLAAQESEVKARLSAAQDRTRVEGLALVSDALWTIPPEGETARAYLTDSVEDRGVRVATNMSDAPRYHAMANTDLPMGMALSAPHVSLSADTALPESLITSIQPHYQVPHAADLPDYFRYALRIAGPLLALGANSPFFPPDLYDPDVTAETVLEDCWMESRISVFESVLNPTDGSDAKVRFPDDFETVEETVQAIAADPVVVPMPVEGSGRFDDDFAQFRLKHGTYWRWVRPVFEGATRSSANARIEFRPIPGQPTVRDSIAFQAAFAGLMESLVRREHPVYDLDWALARENFYAGMVDGLSADIHWITNDGVETTDRTTLYEDLLAHAEDGLKLRGLSDEQVATYLYPLRHRVRQELTPARWKYGEVERRVADGTTLGEAIEGMQRAYLERQADTLIEGTFVDWT
jgi:gamma-glutamyl:cysteine ligase YbdK (ATP-grasp superfamily)